MQKRVALIAIIVEDRESAAEINSILHEFAPYVIGRMGIPYRERNVSIISVAVDAPQDTISTMAGKIGALAGVSCKAAYSTMDPK